MKATRKLLVTALATLALFIVLGQILPGQQFPLRGILSQVVAPKFDGHQLYKEAFDALMRYHIALRDPKVRAQWAATWEHKHDSDKALDSEDGADQAVAEMIRSLGQRYDFYLLPDDTKNEQERMDPSLVGIGTSIHITGDVEAFKAVIDKMPANATLRQRQEFFKQALKAREAVAAGPDHAIEVVEPIDGGAAKAAGILKGDRVVAIDHKPVDGLTLKDVVGKLRGQAGNAVDVTVERTDNAGVKTQVTYTIVRTKFVTHVVHTKDLGSGITYIKLDDFESKYSVDEMRAALTAAAKGKAVILDLRGNPGGLIPNAEAMAQMFIKDGVLLEIKSRHGDEIVTQRLSVEPDFVVRTDSSDPTQIGVSEREPLVIPEDMPVVVLVDENSYSCSEMLAGMLQAHHRAVLVGQPTGGKGVGQTVLHIAFQRTMHVTSLEFLPGGKPMDWVGDIPDVEVTQPAPLKGDKAAAVTAVDAQLAAATKTAQELVDKQAALAKEQEAQRQKHEDAFKKDSQ